MAFQFLCPQGHVLQGEESQAGQQCQCPHCGTLFLIPQPIPAAAAEPPPPGPAAEPPPLDQSDGGFPGIQTAPDPRLSSGSASAPAPQLATADSTPELVHIPCPSGHELETPRDMLGQMAMCPFCQAQFKLRWEDSVECRRRRAEELERKQARAARLWLQWSIAAAVVVVLGLILMIVATRL